MDEAELEERIRKLEVLAGLTEPDSWPDPNRSPAPRHWDPAITESTPLIAWPDKDEDSPTPDRRV
jgi:hypothetical protein